MKFPLKELLIAITIGFIVGLIITYGIWTANQAIKQKEQSLSPIPTEAALVISDSTTPNTEDNTDQFKLTLGQPEIHTLTDQDNIVVSGTTQPFNNVLIYSEKGHQVLIADQDGQFNTEIDLIQGINYLTVTTINDVGQQATINRTIIYSTTEIE